MRGTAFAALSIVLLQASGCFGPNTESEWDRARLEDTIGAYEGFLARHPAHQLAAEARWSIALLQWRSAHEANTISAWRAFLRDTPYHPRADEARWRLLGALWGEAARSDTIQSCEDFLRTCSGIRSQVHSQVVLTRISEQQRRARARLAELKANSADVGWQDAARKDTVEGYKAFLATFGGDRFCNQAHIRAAQEHLEELRTQALRGTPGVCLRIDAPRRDLSEMINRIAQDLLDMAGAKVVCSRGMDGWGTLHITVDSSPWSQKYHRVQDQVKRDSDRPLPAFPEQYDLYLEARVHGTVEFRVGELSESREFGGVTGGPSKLEFSSEQELKRFVESHDKPNAAPVAKAFERSSLRAQLLRMLVGIYGWRVVANASRSFSSSTRSDASALRSEVRKGLAGARTDVLVSALQYDPDWRFRRAVALTLGDRISTRPKDVITALVGATRDDHPTVRCFACFSLGRSSNPRAVAALVESLRAPCVDVRWRAAESLSRLGWSPSTTEERVRMLSATQHWVALVELGPAGEAELVTRLGDDGIGVRLAVAEALKAAGKPVQRFVERIPVGGDTGSRISVMRELRVWGLLPGPSPPLPYPKSASHDPFKSVEERLTALRVSPRLRGYGSSKDDVDGAVTDLLWFEEFIRNPRGFVEWHVVNPTDEPGTTTSLPIVGILKHCEEVWPVTSASGAVAPTVGPAVSLAFAGQGKEPDIVRASSSEAPPTGWGLPPSTISHIRRCLTLMSKPVTVGPQGGIVLLVTHKILRDFEEEESAGRAFYEPLGDAVKNCMIRLCRSSGLDPRSTAIAFYHPFSRRIFWRKLRNPSGATGRMIHACALGTVDADVSIVPICSEIAGKVVGVNETTEGLDIQMTESAGRDGGPPAITKVQHLLATVVRDGSMVAKGTLLGVALPRTFQEGRAKLQDWVRRIAGERGMLFGITQADHSATVPDTHKP